MAHNLTGTLLGTLAGHKEQVMYPRIECGGLQSGHVSLCKPWT